MANLVERLYSAKRNRYVERVLNSVILVCVLPPSCIYPYNQIIGTGSCAKVFKGLCKCMHNKEVAIKCVNLDDTTADLESISVIVNIL